MREAATTADRMLAKAQRDSEAMLEQSRAEIGALWDDVRNRRQQAEESARRAVSEVRTQARPPSHAAPPAPAPAPDPSTDVAARLIDEAFGDTRSRRQP